MSDTNYMNAYVNLAMETVHTYLNDILQLKTQVKILNDLVLEKDQVISSLTSELETLRTNQTKFQDVESEMIRLRDNAATWETQYNNMSNKVSHMDTLIKQYNDLQKQFNDITNNYNDVVGTNQQHEITINEYKAKTVLLDTELTSLKNKLNRLEKKEEKKSSALPVKKSINKEESKPISISKNVETSKETDDDF